MSRYNGNDWFDEGFTILMPVVVFNITGNIADRTMYERIIAGYPRQNLADRAYAYDILYGYTESYGIDWIRRFLSYLKTDHDNSICGSDLTTDTNIVAYLSAALKKDLSDFYIKEGLSIQKSTVIAVMRRWESDPPAIAMVAVVCTFMVAVVLYSRKSRRTP